MANEEHVKILKQGVKAWNKWRKKNPDIVPDLHWADFREVNLSGVGFRKANLREADLRKANLGEASLREANLIGADLHGACLSRAKLSDAKLRRSNLSKADLAKTDLYGANLRRANLSGANLIEADFRDAKLRRADISDANISKAKLNGANLNEANLSGANFSGANLSYSRMVEANFTNAVLTGAKLYGAARDDWKIDGVKCKYVYFDPFGRQRTPADRDFEEGEFERLYKQMPTIEYFFKNGMKPLDPLIMDRVVSAIREDKPEYDLKIDSINARGIVPSIKFTVQEEGQKEEALKKVKEGYEKTIAKLEGRIDTLLEINKALIDKPQQIGDIHVHNSENFNIGGGTVNVTQYIQNITALQKAIAGEPSLTKTVKDKAMDILGGAAEDAAKGLVTKVAKTILELGKELGPVVVNTAAYAFFKSMLKLSKF